MIYSVHGYYKKYRGRKPEGKIEAIVFAENSQLAQSLVEELFDSYPADLFGFTVVGGQERDLQKIYAERPELSGITPERGYIYNEFAHMAQIRKYFK